MTIIQVAELFQNVLIQNVIIRQKKILVHITYIGQIGLIAFHFAR